MSESKEILLRREKTRVVLAEDDPDLRGIIAGALRDHGYDVWEASNGIDLLDRVGSLLLCEDEREVPQLIISDVRMPGVTGLEVLSGLAESSWEIPVILMTAFGDRRTHAEAAKMGAKAFFDKPFRLRDLLDVVRTIRQPVTWSASEVN